MKKRIISISFILTLIISLFGCVRISNNATIFVATDTHYLSSKINDKSASFQRMLDNSDGKLVAYCDEIFEAFSEEVIESKPDVLILSGDLTFNGEKQSHLDFTQKLKHIQDNGVQVLAIAGNHDINNKNAFEYKDDGYLEAETITPKEFNDLYFEFGMKQAEIVDDYSLSYLYRVNSGLYILMLDTNAYGKNFVQPQTFKWLEKTLGYVESENAKVITVSHQNVFAHNEQLSFGYQIYNANELLKIYKEYNVRCNLSGHIHLQHIKEDGLTEISTSSMLVAPCQYGIVKYGKNISYKTKAIDVAKWAKSNSIDDENLLDFNNYAPNYFQENGKRKSLEQMKDLDYTEEEKEEIASTFAKLNIAYFSGQKCKNKDIRNGVELIKKKESFLSRYIDTMLEEASNDYNELKIKS